MRLTISLAATLTLAAVVVAQPPAPAEVPAPVAAAPEPTGDLKKWQGFWKPESVVHQGVEQLPGAKQREELTLVVKRSEYRLYVAANAKADEHVRLATADLTLNEVEKSFEMVIVGGRKKGEKRHGVYDFAGGKLRLCYTAADKPRPAKFESLAGQEQFLEVWAAEKLPAGAK